MTARTVARQREMDWELNELTSRNVRKVTQFRKDGAQVLEEAIRKLKIAKREEAAAEIEEIEEIEGDLKDVPNPEQERAAALAEKVDLLKKSKA